MLGHVQVSAIMEEFRRKHLSELTALSASSGTSLGFGYGKPLDLETAIEQQQQQGVCVCVCVCVWGKGEVSAYKRGLCLCVWGGRERVVPVFCDVRMNACHDR